MSSNLYRIGRAVHQITEANLADNTYHYAATYDTLLRATDMRITRISDSAVLFAQTRTFDSANNITASVTTLPTGTDTLEVPGIGCMVGKLTGRAGSGIGKVMRAGALQSPIASPQPVETPAVTLRWMMGGATLASIVISAGLHLTNRRQDVLFVGQ